MNKIYAFAAMFTFITFAYTYSFAQDTARKQYHLFKPLPKSLMREDMETDRPNVTESPYTVEAGHFQYEADFFNKETLHTEQSIQNTWLINQANLKFGILKNTALQLKIQSYGHEFSQDLVSGDKQKGSGFGDVTLRVKQNLLGNYDGNFSIAVMPYVKFPINRYSDNKNYEEGLMVPMVVKLPHDWRVGIMVEGDRLKDDDTEAMHNELLQSLTVSHVLFKKLEVFGESYYTYNFKNHQILNFLDAAFQFEIVSALKVDIGLNYGLQHDAPTNYFAGIAFRY
ncbi:hypothetical protein A0256_00920 [Mucilaginibacter sp. PAMC 26640]|nr:hypothetical protein A0256_00920 [Mucilaginibacter sp. PAMC 26640]